MSISKFKKRYNLTLTPAVVDRFQTLARDLGMPPSVMSTVCEDSLKEISNVFQIAKDKGSINASDMFKLMGQQMDLIEAEVKTRKEEKENVPEQKRNQVSDSKRPKKHAGV